ncbi:MAG: hypothetical protein KC910_32855 [Candidatus Eremiobacteraeota bacterium]|nr:hypothetical protein [Candidatus Eremiobacteraeota bacterium]
MSEHQKHLYAIMYPNRALIASQLDPHAFGKHYSVGTKRYYSGKMLFIEVDLDFRHEYFPIDEYLAQTVEHEDGSPKQTKFVSSYRVLEHLPLDKLGSLYAVTVNGETLKIDAQEYTPPEETGRVRIIQELNPLQLLIATTHDHRAFGKELTTPGNPKGAPKLFFTQFEFNAEDFQKRWQENPFMSPPIPGVHPQKLNVAITQLLNNKEPANASIGLQSVFDKMLYRNVRHGFFLAEGDNLKFYPMPGEADLQRNHYSWWRAST